MKHTKTVAAKTLLLSRIDGRKHPTSGALAFGRYRGELSHVKGDTMEETLYLLAIAGMEASNRRRKSRNI